MALSELTQIKNLLASFLGISTAPNPSSAGLILSHKEVKQKRILSAANVVSIASLLEGGRLVAIIGEDVNGNWIDSATLAPYLTGVTGGTFTECVMIRSAILGELNLSDSVGATQIPAISSTNLQIAFSGSVAALNFYYYDGPGTGAEITVNAVSVGSITISFRGSKFVPSIIVYKDGANLFNTDFPAILAGTLTIPHVGITAGHIYKAGVQGEDMIIVQSLEVNLP